MAGHEALVCIAKLDLEDRELAHEIASNLVCQDELVSCSIKDLILQSNDCKVCLDLQLCTAGKYKAHMPGSFVSYQAHVPNGALHSSLSPRVLPIGIHSSQMVF